MTSPALETEIKQLIIDSLMLEDLTPADIDTDAPLFVDGLGLDSIDALELGVALQKKYGIQISSETGDNKAYFASVAAMAKMVEEKRQK